MEPTPAAKLIKSQRVLVIAHRGNSHSAPENTLAAFTSAIQVGADLVELDYYHSADHIPVVFHDKDLDRTTNARQVFRKKNIPLTSKTLAQLRRLDAGKWFDAKFTGTTIPTLQEAIRTIQNGSVTLIEHKQGDAATCIKLLQRLDVLDEVVVQSFDWQYISQCHQLAPSLSLAALGNKKLTDKILDDIQRTGAKTVGWKQQRIQRREIEMVHRRGLKIWVYTVNETGRAAELIRDGIDGIITNRPQAIKKLLSQLQQ